MPTLVLQPDGTDGIDTFISNFADSNFGTNSQLQVGESNADTNAIQRSLLKFDLSSIPNGSTITSAVLTLTYEQAASFRASNNRTMSVYRMIRSWSETESTWSVYSSGNNWGTAGASNTTSDREATDIGTVALATSDADESEKSITLTASKVQEWVNGTLTNNGILLQVATELNDLYIFHSSDSATASKRPKLTIVYTPPANMFLAF